MQWTSPVEACVSHSRALLRRMSRAGLGACAFADLPALLGRRRWRRACRTRARAAAPHVARRARRLRLRGSTRAAAPLTGALRERATPARLVNLLILLHAVDVAGGGVRVALARAAAPHVARRARRLRLRGSTRAAAPLTGALRERATPARLVNLLILLHAVDVAGGGVRVALARAAAPHVARRARRLRLRGSTRAAAPLTGALRERATPARLVNLLILLHAVDVAGGGVRVALARAAAPHVARRARRLRLRGSTRAAAPLTGALRERATPARLVNLLILLHAVDVAGGGVRVALARAAAPHVARRARRLRLRGSTRAAAPLTGALRERATPARLVNLLILLHAVDVAGGGVRVALARAAAPHVARRARRLRLRGSTRAAAPLTGALRERATPARLVNLLILLHAVDVAGGGVRVALARAAAPHVARRARRLRLRGSTRAAAPLTGALRERATPARLVNLLILLHAVDVAGGGVRVALARAAAPHVARRARRLRLRGSTRAAAPLTGALRERATPARLVNLLILLHAVDVAGGGVRVVLARAAAPHVARRARRLRLRGSTRAAAPLTGALRERATPARLVNLLILLHAVDVAGGGVRVALARAAAPHVARRARRLRLRGSTRAAAPLTGALRERATPARLVNLLILLHAVDVAGGGVRVALARAAAPHVARRARRLRLRGSTRAAAPLTGALRERATPARLVNLLILLHAVDVAGGGVRVALARAAAPHVARRARRLRLRGSTRAAAPLTGALRERATPARLVNLLILLHAVDVAGGGVRVALARAAAPHVARRARRLRLRGSTRAAAPLTGALRERATPARLVNLLILLHAVDVAGGGVRVALARAAAPHVARRARRLRLRGSTRAAAPLTGALRERATPARLVNLLILLHAVDVAGGGVRVALARAAAPHVARRARRLRLRGSTRAAAPLTGALRERATPARLVNLLILLHAVDVAGGGVRVALARAAAPHVARRARRLRLRGSTRAAAPLTGALRERATPARSGASPPRPRPRPRAAPVERALATAPVLNDLYKHTRHGTATNNLSHIRPAQLHNRYCFVKHSGISL
ncbi:uncharacterized protein LOC125234874 [Leguminivora glycinivorella]|uniref:uncharacterized protein LOC125234874 n=1 Tax=Leguminivora glycinivorella TaxID=1035111 RepID=UPI002010C334|nr:uncharacterized protein LOC125234874 [Leguminivora glycinivorella]